jgi:hypothetical protein
VTPYQERLVLLVERLKREDKPIPVDLAAALLAEGLDAEALS